MEKVRELLNEFMGGMQETGKTNGESIKAFMGLLETNGKAGAISNKNKELIALGIGVTIRCVYCIVFHTYQAYKAGATKEEIIEVGQVAVSMGGGPSMAYATTYLLAAAKEFEHDFDKK